MSIIKAFQFQQEHVEMNTNVAITRDIEDKEDEMEEDVRRC